MKTSHRIVLSSPSGAWIVTAAGVIVSCMYVLGGTAVSSTATHRENHPDHTNAGSASPDPAVLRWTIDNGGAVLSTGGDLELSGTIGQHDAGLLVGGEYELNGGFWFPLTTGDCNVDGIVNLYDYDSFVGCVTGPGSGPVPPTCGCIDYDQDGDVDFRDWGALQRVFGR